MVLLDRVLEYPSRGEGSILKRACILFSIFDIITTKIELQWFVVLADIISNLAVVFRLITFIDLKVRMSGYIPFNISTWEKDLCYIYFMMSHIIVTISES